MQKSEKIKQKNDEKEKKSFFTKLTQRLKEKDDNEVRRRLSLVVSFGIIIVASYFGGGAELFFGTFPVVIAMLCADRKMLIPIICGVGLLALTEGLPLIYLGVSASLLLIRAIAHLLPRLFATRESKEGLVPYVPLTPDKAESPESETILDGERDALDVSKTNADVSLREVMRDLFCESLHIRAFCAATGGLLCGLFLLIESNFSFYSLCATFTLTLLSPLLTLALGGVICKEHSRREWYRLLSLGVVVFLCVWGSAKESFLGMPVAPIAALLLTLCVCAAKGLPLGLCAAAICGLAFDILYLPLLLLSALLFSLVSAVKKNAGLPVVCGLLVVWCYYIGGESGLISVLPPMLLSIPLYMLVDKYRDMMLSPYGKASEQVCGVYFAEAVTEKTKNQIVKERLDALSEAFSSMSETFYDLCDKYRRPDLLGIKKITESGFEKHCEGCRNREGCWGGDYSSTLDTMRLISAALHEKGSVNIEELPEKFSTGCLRCEKIVDEVNRSIADTTEEILREKAKNIFSASCDDLTAILKDALDSDPEEYECDIEAAERVYDYLCSCGIKSGGAVVWGKRRGSVVVKGVSLSSLDGERSAKICRDISEIVGRPLGEPTFEVGRDGCVMLLRARPEIKVYCAHGSLPKSRYGKDELYIDPFDAPCGDLTESFITDSSYFYSLISDGMGSGGEAAFTAGVCGMFIEKMLCAGNRADVTLRMLNNVIRSENLGFESECSATVDLLELDLMSGSASFIKSGAAPTYIGRAGTVYKVSSRTMPVGIIKDADAKVNKFDVKRGDIIIMISDGICQGGEDCPWLVELLCSYMASNKDVEQEGGQICEELRGRILDEAVAAHSGDGEIDDISVSVTVIG